MPWAVERDVNAHPSTPASGRRHLAALVACALAGLPAGTASSGDRAAVTVEDRLDAARSCVAGQVATGDWTHARPYAVQWVSRERWCLDGATGPDELPCGADPTASLGLRVERDRDNAAVVERVALDLSFAPRGGPWSVQFYGTANRLEPGSPLGAASYALATVSVSRPRADGGGELLSLTRFRFEVGDRVVLAPGEYLAPEELRERLRTPESLLEATLTQLDTLEADVTGLLDRKQLTVCPDPDDPGRFACGPMGDGEGHAMYDTCVRRGLTDEETVQTRVRLRAELEAQRALLKREVEPIHAAVVAALAGDGCWLTIAGER